jgi:hypothetical protein
MSFDNRLDRFDKQIQLLGNIPQYAPNEEELKVSTLTNFYAALSSANVAAGLAETKLTNIRLARNELLYKPSTGLVDTTLSVKAYVKSLFGATSEQFKQISGLTFSIIK